MCTAGIPTVLAIHTSATAPTLESSNFFITEGNLPVTETYGTLLLLVVGRFSLIEALKVWILGGCPDPQNCKGFPLKT
jgi:hypothetical protein